MRRLLTGFAAAVLALTTAISTAPLPAGAQPAPSGAKRRPSACPSVDGPKCHVRLRTGIRMAYVETGPRRGRPVILLHGLTDSSRSWSLAMQALHARRPGWHLMALDQRGQGGSSMPQQAKCRRAPAQCFRAADLAQDVVAFMNAKHLRRATVAGHSMGSVVAQEVALRHPRRVSKLILIASSTTGIDNPTLADFVMPQIRKWRNALEAKGVSWPAGAYGLTPLDADPDALTFMREGWDVDPVAPASFVEAVAQDTAKVRLGTWLGETQALLRVDNARRLRHLRTPTLVLWGTQDAIFYAKPDQQGLVAALKQAARGRGSFSWKAYGKRPLPASGYQVDEIGHNVQWEAPRQVARDIVAFVRTGRPTRDLFHTDAPGNVRRIVTVPGAAQLVQRR